MKKPKSTDARAALLRVDLLGGDEPRRGGAARTRVKAGGKKKTPAASEANRPEPDSTQKTNADVYLTGAAPAVCVATKDLFDRAHSVRGPMAGTVSGGLVPAARGGGKGRPVRSSVANARPRMYPACCMTSQGVAHDSAFDATYERAAALAGVADGVGGYHSTVAEARTDVLLRMGDRGVRALARWGKASG